MRRKSLKFSIVLRRIPMSNSGELNFVSDEAQGSKRNENVVVYVDLSASTDNEVSRKIKESGG